ncbi:ribosome biosynthesis protein LTO1 PWA37_002887 [Arxiozyma heterogenica]
MDYTDKLLELEEQYYEEGFREGQNESLHNSFLEGKQFGLQVGFQRFVLINQIIGICDIIDSLDLKNDSLNKNISIIRHLINNIQMNNDEENVENLDKILIKLKNKFRTVLLSFHRLTKDNHDNKHSTNHLTFNNVEDLSSIIAGKIEGFVEDKEVTEVKVKQDQLHEW